MFEEEKPKGPFTSQINNPNQLANAAALAGMVGGDAVFEGVEPPSEPQSTVSAATLTPDDRAAQVDAVSAALDPTPSWAR